MEKLNNIESKEEADTRPELVLLPKYRFTRSKKKFPVYAAFKRVLDVLCSITGLTVLAPLFAVVAIAIKAEDGGPVIHKRICVGPDDKTYKMYKFRSMKVNADKMFDMFTHEQMKRYKSGDKFEDDPRITKCGKIIRKFSIDELPQIFSVLKNDMSIIGPRPVVEREAEAYGVQKELLLSVKPGITGYWQVNGRSDIPFLSDEAKKLQLYYAQNISFMLDFKILLKTFKVVICGKGAR